MNTRCISWAGHFIDMLQIILENQLHCIRAHPIASFVMAVGGETEEVWIALASPYAMREGKVARTSI